MPNPKTSSKLKCPTQWKLMKTEYRKKEIKGRN